MKVTIVGTGYVGLVTGVILASAGHFVYCVGRNKEKLQKINAGTSPFFEPGLEKLLRIVLKKGLLKAVSDIQNAVSQSEVIIIAVGTPTLNDAIDLSQIEIVSKQIGEALRQSNSYHVVVVKSTVVPGATEKIALPILEKSSGKKVGKDIGLSMNPEFLREGQAVSDALHPDRIVIGSHDEKSSKTLLKLYKEFVCLKVVTNIKTAEMTKYTANSLLATMISFSNEIARICEDTGGIDVIDVWRGVHLDSRLNPIIKEKRVEPGFLKYLFSGCGYGGSCFPKDTKALVSYAQKAGIEAQLLQSVVKINSSQPLRMIAHLKKALKNLERKKIAVLGLAFKPETDDTRESPAIPIIKTLLSEGAVVRVYDPKVKHLVDSNIDKSLVTFSKNVQDAVINSDAVLIVTAWDEYKKLTPEFFWKKMKNPVVIDGRRIYNKDKFLKAGILYRGIGYG